MDGEVSEVGWMERSVRWDGMEVSEVGWDGGQ